MHDHEHLRNAMMGVAGGLVGTLAMGQFFRVVRAATSEHGGEGEQSDQQPEHSSSSPLDDISVTDIESRDDESAPATLARAGYERATGQQPREAVRDRMATGLHWGMGASMGALYGLARGDARGVDLAGGLAFGTAVWAAADELAVPMLGLSEGPTAHPPSVHLQGLGAHLVYGATTAAATYMLRRLV